MPIMVLFVAIMFGLGAFGLALCAIEESPLYWFGVVFFVYFCVMNFLKFLAMC